MLPLLLSCLAFVFAFLGFLSGAWATVNVLAWKRSTHRVEYVRPEELPETKYEIDAPAHLVDQLPSAPEHQTLEQFLRERERSQGEELYDQPGTY